MIEEVVSGCETLGEYVKSEQLNLIFAHRFYVKSGILRGQGLGYIPMQESEALVQDHLMLFGTLSVKVDSHHDIVLSDRIYNPIHINS